ncbi:hypothetical protein Tco_1055492 [Tanacetum coccineum]|uniref:Band 7 domain-containing protein n=1 Tax=Tanacetum coccineum TaxID=301880 RepID=A0ABQ5H194_9ASTR
MPTTVVLLSVGLWAAMIRLRARHHPFSSIPHYLLSSPAFAGTRLERVQLQLPLDRLEVVGQTMGFVSTIDIEIRRWRAEEVGYGIRDVWIDPREAVEEVAPMTLGGVNTRVTELTTVQEQDTQDIYAVIEDTQDRQTQIYQSVGTLVDDSQYHYEDIRLLNQAALVSRTPLDSETLG